MPRVGNVCQPRQLEAEHVPPGVRQATDSPVVPACRQPRAVALTRRPDWSLLLRAAAEEHSQAASTPGTNWGLGDVAQSPTSMHRNRLPGALQNVSLKPTRPLEFSYFQAQAATGKAPHKRQPSGFCT